MRNLNPDDKPLCAEYDPEWWFPEPHSKENPLGVRYQKAAIEQATEALAICLQCPLQKACIEYSMESLETVHYGIYGGTLPYEREMAISAGSPSNAASWQNRIRAAATEKGLTAPLVAKRERPKLLVSMDERALWRSQWDSYSQQAS